MTTREYIHGRLDWFLAACDTPNWDSYGAYPVDPDAVSRAREFIDAMLEAAQAAGLDTAEILTGLGPDGLPAFEWYGRNKDDGFDVSVQADGSFVVWRSQDGVEGERPATLREAVDATLAYLKAEGGEG